MTGTSPAVPRAVGLYLAAVQFCFALGWVVYVAYLPRLAQQAGLDVSWVPWILLADQLVFVVTDLAVGLASDRAAAVIGRIGRWVAVATVLSAAAFMALPWLAPQGSPLLFMAVTACWVLTSSALRAPPLTLLGRYVARPAQPTMVAFTAFGLGVANALAPYLGLQLKGLDPRWPFAVSALALAAVALGMVAAERALARQRDAAASAALTATLSATAGTGTVLRAATPARLPVGLFVVACVLGALAFQWHHAVSSAPLLLRHATADQLPWLLPVFWVGFNLCLVPTGALVRRLGAAPTMAIGAELAMLGAAGAAFAPGLGLLVLAQLATGAGWALLLCAAFSAALDLGHTGHEGLFSGTLQATLALAALARIAVVAGSPLAAGTAVSLAAWPAAVFALCAVLLVLNAVRR